MGLIVIAIVLLNVVQSCARDIESHLGSSYGSDRTPQSTATATSCPTRIADQLPSGGGAQLVGAFRTANKRIMLCRTTTGGLYYYGEFADHREPGIAMLAERTAGGYRADNPPYRYVLENGTVTIYRSGVQIGQEQLAPDPSPR